MSDREDWRKWVATRQEVEARTVDGHVHARGRVFSLAEHPTVGIETETGTVQWAAHLTHAVAPAEDPSRDAIGTVRQSPNRDRTCVRTVFTDSEGPKFRWVELQPEPHTNWVWADDSVRDWTVIGSVPGTPAAEQKHECGFVIGTPDCIDSHPREYPDVSGGGVPYAEPLSPAWKREPRVFTSDGPEPPEDVTVVISLHCSDRPFPYFVRRGDAWVCSTGKTADPGDSSVEWSSTRHYGVGSEFMEVLDV
jgi:hypothetical protein